MTIPPADSADFLTPPRTAHLVGLCGAGMKHLAETLRQYGWTLSGSDLNVTPQQQVTLTDLGIAVKQGHAVEHLPVDCELVIYSAAIPETNPERTAATNRQIPQLSYVEVLSRLMASRFGISVAGTHGKSSTTAMIGHILTQAGHAPLTLLGADVIAVTGKSISSHSPTLPAAPQYCVVESCEFRRHFLQLQPQAAVLTGVEADHFDCYPNLASARAAYAEFLQRLPRGGPCVVSADDPWAIDQARQLGHQPVTYSAIRSQADWSARNVAQRGQEFELWQNERQIGTIRWSQLGLHQVANAVGAAALCGNLGIATEQIVVGLNSFPGLRRRLESRGTRAGVHFYDDYGHHPTSIAAVLGTLRSVLTSGRL
ncbi:MAG: hypothetical protein KDA58_16320, partial [Planctomycetaceae bacterium]|nr:hypothetical protein [Planctomycetaceae bacterium]